ncbi:TIGR04086 family membrane protein [Erwinia billingiae]|jgi:ABC-type transport system involved in multi-copper enzyme maturation permease subunit|uniref:TIGR04086 family membrane protein n=1 Tax=Erwinia billingiae TaxID=182337 RepID=UPI003208C90A
MSDHNIHPVYNDVNTGVTLKRISWSAIFAGVILSVVIYLLLTILGTAIGATTIDPLKEQNPLDGLGTGAAIWTGLSMLISIGAGAFITGRLAQREGALHGLLMWAVNTLFVVWLAISLLSSAVSGTASVIGSGFSMVGNGISAIAPSIANKAKETLKENNFDLGNVQSELEKTLQQTGKPELQPQALKNDANKESQTAQNQAQNTANNPQNADTDLANWFKGVLQRNQDTLQAADVDALKNIIKARTGKSDQEVDQIVAQTQKSYEQARQKYQELKAQAEQKAREAAQQAAAATAKASWMTLIVLLIEAAVAGALGMMGRKTQPRQVVVR